MKTIDTIASMNAEMANCPPIIRERINEPFLPFLAVSRSASMGLERVISQAGYMPAPRPTARIVTSRYGSVAR